MVVPAELRERMNLHPGTALVMLETPQGVVLVTREQMKTLVRRKLQGTDLVDELLADRRRQAAAEDAA